MKTKNNYVLIIIFILALALRLLRLGDYPALNADEAALGYNAYSLIKTGMDEHGNPWPINFESFGDYKPGLTVYLILPFVWLFDLSIWSVRILPAFLGAFTVVVIYYLAKILRKNYLKLSSDKYEYLAAFLLAISPWHLHFSRGAWEVNIATLFISLGMLFGLRKPISKWSIILSAIFFVLSMYTYHSARVISPLLALSLAFVSRERFLKNIKAVFGGVAVGIVLVIPLVLSVFSAGGLSRAGVVSIFSDMGIISKIDEQRNLQPDPGAIHVRLIHNRPVYYTIEFIDNYVSHFTPEFLFLSGDEITRNKVPNMGQLYIFEAFSILVAFYYIIRKPKGWMIIVLWLLIAPIPASLTFQSPHALRAQNMIIPLTLISAFGLERIVSLLKPTRKFAHASLIIVITFAFFSYLLSYHRSMAREYPFSSQYGMQELVEYIAVNGASYDEVIITDRYDQPYILFLFYLKYPPEKFQNDHLLTPRDNFGFSTVPGFDKYSFKEVDFENLLSSCQNCLVAGTDEQIPPNADIIKEIYFPNGEVAFQLAEIK